LAQSTVDFSFYQAKHGTWRRCWIEELVPTFYSTAYKVLICWLN
jgi:hypothetical protein